MYTPAPRADGLNTEYLEIYNSNPWWDDLGGYQLAGQVQYTFPSPTIIPGGGFLVVAAAPAAAESAYGITNVMGPYTGSLRKGGEIQLINAAQGILLDVTYTNRLPWPAGASKTGSLDRAGQTHLRRGRSTRLGHQRRGRRFARGSGGLPPQPVAQRND